MGGVDVRNVLGRLRRLCDDRSLSDGRLLDRYLGQADEAAFTALVHRHAGMVLGVCRRVLADPHAAEDVLQATFLVLARRAGTIRNRPSLASWLHGVAYRLAEKARSQEARRRIHEKRAAAVSRPSPPAEAAWRELQQILDEELARLPDKHRLPLVLCYLEDQTHEEAAARLGWPVGTVKSRLSKGRELLRARLTRRGLTLSAASLATALAAGAAPGSVPVACLRTAVRAGMLVHAGKAPAEILSGNTIALAEGSLRGLARGRLTLALLGALSLAVLGGVALALPNPQGATGQPAKAMDPSPAPAEIARRDFHGDPLPEGALARLGTLRMHPGARVWALCYSPDGKRLASGGEDGKVRVWDSATGKELLTLDLKQCVRAVTFVPGKGGLLAAGGDDQRVRVWEASTGKLIAELAHPFIVKALAASPDGKSLAVGANHQITLWALPAGKKLRTWAAHSNGVSSLAFTPDGSGLLSGARARLLDDGTRGTILLGEVPVHNDGGMTLWDPRTGRVRKKFAEHAAEARVLGFTPDGRHWASAGYGRDGPEFRIWDAQMRSLRTIPTRDIPYRLDFGALSPDGSVFAAAGPQVVFRWEVASGKRLPSLDCGTDYIPRFVAFSPDGRTLATAGVSARILLWDVTRDRPRNAFPAHERGLWAVAVARDGKTAVTGGLDGAVREWDLATGKPLRVLRHEGIRGSLIASARYSPDGSTLALSYFWGVSLWDAASGKRLRAIHAPHGKGRVTSLDFSPDGSRLAWQAIDDDDLHIWDVRAGKEIRRLPQGKGGTYALAYAPTGDRLASVSSRLRLWDADTGKEDYQKPLMGHCLTYSPDGTLLAVFSDPIRLLEAATGEEAARIPWPARHGGIWGMAFSPDGRYLAVTAEENVAVWDVAARKFVHTFGSHRQNTASVAFPPDGRRLISASEDTTALVWDMGAVKAEQLPALDPASAWEDLAGRDRLKAYETLVRLRQAPDRAVALLRERLRPVAAVDRARLEKLLKDLEAGSYAVRERATEELKGLVDQVRPRLAKLAERPTSLETRRRLARILPPVGYTLETRRALWCLRLLEMAGTAEARALLERMAGGEPEAAVTRHARATLERLARTDPRTDKSPSPAGTNP